MGILLRKEGKEHSRTRLQGFNSFVFSFVLIDLQNIRMATFIDQWIWPHSQLMSCYNWGVLEVKHLLCDWSEFVLEFRKSLRLGKEKRFFAIKFKNIVFPQLSVVDNCEPYRYNNADLKIYLYVWVHIKTIPWKFRILKVLELFARHLCKFLKK